MRPVSTVHAIHTWKPWNPLREGKKIFLNTIQISASYRKMHLRFSEIYESNFKDTETLLAFHNISLFIKPTSCCSDLLFLLEVKLEHDFNLKTHFSLDVCLHPFSIYHWQSIMSKTMFKSLKHLLLANLLTHWYLSLLIDFSIIMLA